MPRHKTNYYFLAQCKITPSRIGDTGIETESNAPFKTAQVQGGFQIGPMYCFPVFLLL